MFAIIDIETTGGNPNVERVIEIAVIIHDGTKTIEEFSTLVNPEKEISAFISTFTGITNHMVSTAPTFNQIADKILALTENKIFVAHNVKFDYGFLKYEFRRLDKKFSRKQLCTVQLSRKTFPQYRSHSLGNICRDLNIPIDNRHRAMGDAKATTLLFEKIIACQNSQFFDELEQDELKQLHLPQKLHPNTIIELPEETGIVYYRNEQQDLLAIQAYKNIKEGVIAEYKNKLFNFYKKKLHEETTTLHYELTGNELLALLLEEQLKQELKPKYNKINKHYDFSFGLFDHYDERGFRKLAIKLLEEGEQPLIKFTSKFKAEKVLKQIIHTNRLDPIFKRLDSAFHYNERIDEVLKKFMYPYADFFIIDNGKSGTEKLAIKIQQGNLIGYTFYEPSFIQQDDELHQYIKPIKEFSDTKKHILKYLQKNQKYIKLIPY